MQDFHNKFNAAASNFGPGGQSSGIQPSSGLEPGPHSPNAINNPVSTGGQQCHLDSSSPLNKFEHLQDKFGQDQIHAPMASPVSASSLASPTSSRPQPARSPYEWMKKPSYQCQPEKSGKYHFLKTISFCR